MLGACCAERGACPRLRAALGALPSTLCTLPPNACSEAGRLTRLSLVSEGLACLLPPALGQLRSLRRLDLTFNEIQGRCGCFPRLQHMMSTLSDAAPLIFPILGSA